MKITNLSPKQAALESNKIGEIILTDKHTFLPHFGVINIGTDDIGSKFSRLVQNDTKYSLIQGGRASGKSYTTSLLITLLTYEPNQVILYTRYTMSSASASIIQEFRSRVEDLGLEEDFEITNNEITNLQSGSRILFKGFKVGSSNQTASLKSLEGLTMLVVEEAEEVTEYEDFSKVVNSIRQIGVKNRVWLILNAAYRTHWIHDRYFKANQIEEKVAEDFNGVVRNTAYIHGSYKDIKHVLSEDFLYDVDKLRQTNYERYKHTYLGAWKDVADGIIFNDFALGEYKATDREALGIDFGFSDTNAGVLVSVCNDTQTIYLKEAFSGNGQTGLEIAKDVVRFYNTEELDMRTIRAFGDSSRPEILKEIKRQGITRALPSKKYAGSVLDGIDLMRQYKILVDSNSENLLEALQSYKWKSNVSKPTPQHDESSHWIDAARYACEGLVNNNGVYAIDDNVAQGTKVTRTKDIANDYIRKSMTGTAGNSYGIY